MRPEIDTGFGLKPLIRAHPIFTQLGERAVADFVAHGRRMHVTQGEVLVRQGDESDCAFLLLEGEAEVFVETSYGPVTVASLRAGDLFGEIGAFAAIPRTATVRTRTKVEVLRIGRDLLVAAGRTHPDLLLSVIGLLGQRIATISRAIGFYTHALAALERHDFDPSILDELLNPVPELLSFTQTFRRMAEQIILRRAHHEEMASAAAIQRAMLPAPAAAESCDPRVEISAMIRPAKEVGGDLYNYFLVDPDRLAIVIADVSGKGVPASLFMAITQTVMRLTLRDIDHLAAAVGRANALLSADNQESMFATLFCGLLDLRSGELAYVNCGHNPPLLLRAAGGCETLSPCGPALAILPSVVFRTRSLTLAPGDRLFLYTDGITEASNAALEQFGDDRLAAACNELRDAAPQDLIEQIVRRVDAFVGAAPQFDDITCLAVRYRG